MEKTFYMVYVDGQGAPTYKHETKESAENEAKRLAKKLRKSTYVLESKDKYKDNNIETMRDACKFLGINTPMFHHHPIAITKNTMTDIPSKHQEAVFALIKLFVIAEAWNKIDGFKPDFSNPEQYKYFPWFKYDSNTAGFVCSTYHATASANVGSRLCFKTSERAEQFGKQYIADWNKVLLLDENLPF